MAVTMRILAMLVAVLSASVADVQVTKIAMFENFAAGQSFQPSFTDP